jgi:hypothetical protein
MSVAATGTAVRGLKRSRVRLGVALCSGSVLYSISRAIYGGPGTPSDEAGDVTIAMAEAEAAEDAA